MKKVKFIALSLAILISSNLLVSCYGGFKLTGKLYKWNGSLGNKWVKSLVFFVLCVLPVYDFCLLIDGIILNTIEFWTGSNPLSMNEGEQEIKTIEKDGKIFEIKATKNRFDIAQISGPDAGKSVSLVYNPSEIAWYAEDEMKSVKLVQLTNENGVEKISLFFPNNQVVQVDAKEVGNVADAKGLIRFFPTNLAAK